MNVYDDIFRPKWLHLRMKEARLDGLTYKTVYFCVVCGLSLRKLAKKQLGTVWQVKTSRVKETLRQELLIDCKFLRSRAADGRLARSVCDGRLISTCLASCFPRAVSVSRRSETLGRFRSVTERCFGRGRVLAASPRWSRLAFRLGMMESSPLSSWLRSWGSSGGHASAVSFEV